MYTGKSLASSDSAPRYAILDRDGKYGQAVPAALQNMGVKPVPTAPLSP
jgi:hypothetical protein